MIHMSVADIARLTGGQWVPDTDPDAIVTGPAEFDSRAVRPGGLFFCLPGAQVDGHDFAEQAVSSGAACVLAAREVTPPAVVVPAVPVPETNSAAYDHDPHGHGAAVLAALGALARHNVDVCAAHGMKVIGVTGSAGKTTVKDLIASVVRRGGEVVAPPGSFNNEIGHPYTALRCDTDTDFLVAEMSARGVGHVAHLAQIAPPVIGVVLNVGTAHIGEFGSQETIAQAKGELVEALPAAGEGGVAVLNVDDPLVAAMASRTKALVRTVSATGREADVMAHDVQLDEHCRASFSVTAPHGVRGEVRLQLVGEHQVSNALCAIAAGLAAGIAAEDVFAAVNEHVAVSSRRMDVRRRADGVTIINDSYNANPDSMAAGIRTLVHTARATGGRAWAVLGQMNELGPDAADRHHEVGELLADAGVDQVVAVGNGVTIHALAASAQERGVAVSSVESTDAALNVIWPALSGDDVVLVKASSSERLWRVAEGLLANEDNAELQKQEENQ